MAVSYSLIQTLLIPLAFVPVTYVSGRALGKKTGLVAFIPLMYSLMLLLGVEADIAKVGYYREVYSWVPILNLSFGLLADGLNIWVLITINLLCLLISIYSIPYMEHRFHEWEHETGEHVSSQAYATYYALYLLYAVGMTGTVLSTNLIQFYLFYELMLIPSWAMINNYGYGEREKIGMMYFLWTHVGAVILLVGILSSYWITGSFEVDALPKVATSPIASWIAIAILIGFFTKMAVFGLHIWLPYAHAEAPTPISALLSPAMIGIGAYAAARLVILPLHSILSNFSLIFSIWAVVTMTYGGLMALAQDDIKRFLAYSSISQMGYLFLGLASGDAYGVAGAIFHYVSHGIGKCILFCVAGILIFNVGTRSISRLGGLADRMPITATLALLGFFIIGGVPPTIGFMSKVMLFTGVFNGALKASPSQLTVAIVAIIMTALTIGYSLWTVRRIFFGPLSDEFRHVKEAPPLMIIPLFVLAVLAILVGIYPRFVTDYLLNIISH